MKKKLNANALILDLRHLTEETLSTYESVSLNATITLLTPRVQALLSQYSVNLNTLLSRCLPDDEALHLSTANGKTTLSAAVRPDEKQVLIVNGKLTITADAADTLRQYEAILVNGKAFCPASLSALFTQISTVNGKLIIYPDEAVVLPGRSAKLDRTFLLRAQSRLYWTERLFLAVDPKLDAAALAAKGCCFAAPKAILSEAQAEVLAPLFTDETELVILPEGASVVDDDLDLTAAALRRYGTKLYVLGDVTVPEGSADLLARIEMLHVDGDVQLPEALEDAFYAIPDLECGEVTHEAPTFPLPDLKEVLAPDAVHLNGLQLTL